MIFLFLRTLLISRQCRKLITNTTVIERKTNPTDLKDTNFCSYMLYSFTLWLQDSCSATFWQSSLILSTIQSISLLSSCLGREARSDSQLMKEKLKVKFVGEGARFWMQKKYQPVTDAQLSIFLNFSARLLITRGVPSWWFRVIQQSQVSESTRK